jgi:hypothetical protein
VAGSSCWPSTLPPLVNTGYIMCVCVCVCVCLYNAAHTDTQTCTNNQYNARTAAYISSIIQSDFSFSFYVNSYELYCLPEGKGLCLETRKREKCC